MVIKLLPQLEALVQQATFSANGNASAQTAAISAFVSSACSLASHFAGPVRSGTVGG